MRNVYDTKKTVTKKMKAYLKEKYKEDFEIYALRPVSGGYTAYIIPSKDINTPKGKDDFYEATVAMRTKPIYFLGQHMFNLHKDLLDTQWRIEVKEKFNNLIGKEIEKLFGKNYLTALEMKLTRDLLKKEKFSHTMSEADIQEILKRNEIVISGGVYIFGRVENEADREYYRKQIYEFIQYLKAENMFDYTDINIFIKDERTLLKKESQEILSTLDFKGLIPNESIELINKSLTPLNEKYNQLTDKEKQRILNSTNKSNPFKGEKGFLLLVKIASPKFVGNFFRQDLVKQTFDGRKEYNTIQDVKFKGDEF